MEAKTWDVSQEQTEKTELRANARIVAGQIQELNARTFAHAGKTTNPSPGLSFYVPIGKKLEGGVLHSFTSQDTES